MYSMVLMMAMSASPEAAALGKHGCDGGCSGVVTSCYGSSCHGGKMFGGRKRGCFGSSCSGGGCYGGGCFGGGCHGGGCHGGGGLFSKHHGGGCCGGGGMFAGGCHGGGGLFSKHHGGGCCGGGGCYGGGCSGSYAPGGCNGTYGPAPYGPGMYGPAPYGPGGVVPPPPAPPKKGGVTSLPAYITLNVPADAKVTIDGAATTSTSSVRVFSTPELAPGAVYYYTIRAEVVRDGQTLSATEKVAVEAGAKAELSLNPAATPVVASK